jgi:RNA polymerase sigma factor (sigma-70 family)
VREIPADEFAQRLHGLRGPIKTVLSRFAVPPEDAEDVMQEVFVIVWQKWAGIYNLESFVVGVTRNRCWYWLKRRLRHRGLLAPLEEMGEGPAVPPPQEAVDEALRLQASLAPLRFRERKALRLRWLGYTHRQVAASLGLAESSTRKLVARALRKLSEKVHSASPRRRQR